MRENDPLPFVVEKKSLSLSIVRTDGGTQARDGLDEDVVAEYAEAIKAGKKLPPLKVVWDGAHYWLWDGFHTATGAQAAGKRSWMCEISHGNLSLARLMAASANQGHGLRRSNNAKRRAVEMALKERPDWSSRGIAEHCGVSHGMVDAVRKACAELANLASSPERRTGLDGKSRPVSPRQKDEPEATAAAPIAADTSEAGPPPAHPDQPPPTPLPPGTDEPTSEPDIAPPAEPEPEPTAPAPAQPTAQPESEPIVAPTPMLDAVGLPVPDCLRDSFNALDRFRGIMKLIREAERYVSDLAESAGGEALRRRCALIEQSGRQRFRLDKLHNAISELQSCEPAVSICPACHEHHPGRLNPQCRACLGTGWVTRHVWDNSHPECRAAAQRSRRAVAGDAA